MGYGINKVMIMGYLESDPTLKYYAKGKASALCCVITNEARTGGHSGERKAAAHWHQICFFGPLAEVVIKLLHKGCYVYIEGYLSTRRWQDNTGQKHYACRVVGRELQLLSSAEKDCQTVG